MPEAPTSELAAAIDRYLADLRLQLDERGDELAAARAANRELMLRANTNR